jgi:hypothetical protein
MEITDDEKRFYLMLHGWQQRMQDFTEYWCIVGEVGIFNLYAAYYRQRKRMEIQNDNR